MADELATITGVIYRNTADDPDRVPWVGARVLATPVLLDETAAVADSRTTRGALTDSAGLVTLHLWPGAWRIILPDGEVLDGDGTGVVVEAGTTYTLLELRGYVAPPGTSVTTVQLPTGGTSGQLLAKASGDDYDVEWKSAAGTGDMLAATYDPTGVAADAFEMGNMVEAADAKILTAAERALLAQQSGTNTGDQDLSGYALTADLGTAATLDVGTTAGTVAAGDDTRLSDARTPTAHASTHATGQSDALTAADIGAAPAPTGTPDGTKYYRDDGTWAIPEGGVGSSLVEVTAVTASHTLALTDAGKAVEVTSATPVDVTIPLNATVAFDVGTVVEVYQLGAGQVSIVATSGVTLESRGSLVDLAGQYAVASLRKRATDTWVLAGDLA